jgi:hypothetical protein
MHVELDVSVEETFRQMLSSCEKYVFHNIVFMKDISEALKMGLI